MGKNSDIILTKSHLVCVETDVRSNIDRRVFVDRHVVAYFDSEGNEYRKSFECRTGGSVKIPQGGYNSAINEWKRQWDTEIVKTSKATARIERAAPAKSKPKPRIKTGTGNNRKAEEGRSDTARRRRTRSFFFEFPIW